MAEMSVVMPVIAAGVGTLLAVMLGMALSKLNGIDVHLGELNGKFYTHVTNQSVHEAGFARTDEKLKSLMDVTFKLHERVDHVEEVVHGKG